MNTSQPSQHPTITTPQKASLLHECFSACFNRDIPPVPPTDDAHHTLHFSPCPHELLCTGEEAIYLIMSLDPSKANRPDEILAQMFKGTAHSIAPSLTKLFNITTSLPGVLEKIYCCSNS